MRYRMAAVVAVAALPALAGAQPASANFRGVATASASDEHGRLDAVCEYVVAAGGSSHVGTRGTATATPTSATTADWTSISCFADPGGPWFPGCSAISDGPVAICSNATIFDVFGVPALCAEATVWWTWQDRLTVSSC